MAQKIVASLFLKTFDFPTISVHVFEVKNGWQRTQIVKKHPVDEMNLPSTKNQVLKKLGIHNPKRKKQKKKVNDMLEVGNKYSAFKIFGPAPKFGLFCSEIFGKKNRFFKIAH